MAERTIVVCDDDEFVYFAVEMTMQKMGFRVLEARNGLRGIELVTQNKPVAMFLDIEMPRMTGFEVCEKLKADPATRDTPIIYVSGIDVEGNMPRILDSGADYIVSKPFQPDDLAADLYFLLQANFKPDPATLSHLRVTRCLEAERLVREHKPPEKKERPPAAEETEPKTAHPELPDEVSPKSFRNLQRLVLALTQRMESLETLLTTKRLVSEDEMKKMKIAAAAQLHAKQLEKKE